MTTKKIKIAYGDDFIEVQNYPNIKQVVSPNILPKPPALGGLLKKALNEPVGSPPLRELAEPGDRVAVLLSDPARNFPKQQMFDAVIDELHKAGVKDEDIRLIVASGLHPVFPDERIGIYEAQLKRYNCIWNDARDNSKLGFIGLTPGKRDWPGYISYLGRIAQHKLEDPAGELLDFLSEISRRDKEALKFRRIFSLPARVGITVGATLRTPVSINRQARSADLIVTIGQIKPHYFAGFGGGAKSILPGVAGKLTIGANHASKTHPRARLGVLEGNLARRDMEDAARLYRGKLFMFNVCMDSKKRVRAAAAGDIVKAHRMLVPWVRRIGQVKVGERTDIVIAGQSLPASMNVWQMTKTVVPAAKCVKPGGVIICAGPCREGVGGSVQSCEAIYQIGMLKFLPPRVDVKLICEMRDLRPFRNMFFDPQPSIEQAMEQAWEKCGRNASITVLTDAGPMITVAPEEDDSDWDDDLVPRYLD